MIKYDLFLTVQQLHIPIGMWTKAMSATGTSIKEQILTLIRFTLRIQGHHLLSSFAITTKTE